MDNLIEFAVTVEITAASARAPETPRLMLASAEKVPLPLPRRHRRLPSNSRTYARSALPSAFKSPVVTPEANVPGEALTGVAKEMAHWPIAAVPVPHAPIASCMVTARLRPRAPDTATLERFEHETDDEIGTHMKPDS
ncbi:MAG: hypothetical protein NTV94_00465 [Planctomycetota bacterium]|nr:hypothetical protein [Planctomycetota bacterium]